MSFIPDPPMIFVLLENIIKEVNLLQNSCELFWRFCLQSKNPKEFKERVEFWRDIQLEDGLTGKGFQNPETRDFILAGPEIVSEAILNKLETIREKTFIPYIPDEEDDPVNLNIYLYIESCHLTHFLRSEAYSERTRETLEKTINISNRLKKTKVHKLDLPLSEFYSASLYALDSYLHNVLFYVQKGDALYKDALQSLFWCYANNKMVKMTIPVRWTPCLGQERDRIKVGSRGN
jgi:hypothetical protein